MLKSLLIANRGEIARRVIRTCRRLGVRAAAIYSQADAAALHVREADTAALIGPAPAKDSYLRGDKIIAAAKQAGVEAIHPGYGFLSENADFAQDVLDAGLIWIGPKPASIRAMGLKDAAKRLMDEAGVPTTPGYLGEDQDEARLQAEADAIGYPVLIKAVAGGGGKGMRKVDKAKDFKAALASARREAAAAFGDDRVLLEMYVRRPRHIEVQVFGDTHGQVVHLFERDCSLQRRHQKVIEEAPAPGMDAGARKAVTEAAVLAARAVNYVGAGTVEFIADASEGLRGDRIWFMEMNTRLQVEHPVTEEITGQDLVEWQLRVASGEKLPLQQHEISINGHAIEARLYAENPDSGYLPSIGRIDHLYFPDRVRVDTGIEQGDEVSPYYDPMIAKLIAHGNDRAVAAAMLELACARVRVSPIRTNAGMLTRTLGNADFLAGDLDTGFLATRNEVLAKRPPPSDEKWTMVAGCFAASNSGFFGFRLNAPPRAIVHLVCDDERRQVVLTAAPIVDEASDFSRGVVVFEQGEFYLIRLDTGDRAEGEAAAGDGAVMSPMPGKVVSIAVKAGARVKKGDPLMVLEAMKMEHTLTAPFDGKVAELKAKAGEQVSEGVLLAKLEAAS